MAGQMMLHCGAKDCTRAELVALPEPEAIGKRHKPVHPGDFAEGILTRFAKEGWYLRDNHEMPEQYGIYGDKEKCEVKVFGLLRVFKEGQHPLQDDENGIALAWRMSTDMTIAPGILAGHNPFICDNLAFSAEWILMKRKSTLNFDLGAMLYHAAAQLDDVTGMFAQQLATARLTEIDDTVAGAMMAEAAGRKLISPSKIGGVWRNYFKPEDTWTDCRPRTRCGLLNAFTRELRETVLRQRIAQTQKVGKFILPELN